MANTIKLGNGNWATKEGSLLAYNDENNNFKPLPFTTTRASSASVVNKQGLIETVGSGIPRIDFSDDANGALLLEPSRTNLFLTSASGVYGSSPASETNTISPDGTLNAVIPTPDTTSNRYQYDVSSGTYATNTKLAYSWYRKRISTPIDTSHIGDLHIKSLSNASQVGSTTQIESDVNGFDRFQAVLNITDGSLPSIIRGYFGGVVGIGNSSVAYFGHQMELGDFSTSYIPTYGSVKTRVLDVCTNSGNDQVINSTEGTIYGEQKSLETDFNYNYFAAVSDGTQNNRLEIRQTGTGLQFLWRVGGNYQDAITLPNAPFSSTIKYALRYSSTDIKFYVNGSLVDTINSPTLYSAGILNNIQFADGENSNNFRGTVKECKYYNTALTDAELTTLTTI